ncbi:heterokaryon incompatibility protein-domain-containing protein [Cladorrhinum samala]|uniref:Heterokaryon incompatibility protein-domain-containing protein n=1 Tax=Cladorrhinum samala TaxID=585594 RepID=A0AAV9HP18_9PEZI|nr:heterokaryon incompatibility protein-domain-containing protein [Cladorrhinum samala]
MSSSSWHETICSRPDVSLVDGVPFCMSCGTLGLLDDLSPSQAPPPFPVPSGGRPHLSVYWPASVQYSNTCIGASNEELSDVLNKIAEDMGASGREDSTAEENEISDAESEASSAGTLQQSLYHEDLVLPEELVGKDRIRILRLSKGKGSEPLHGNLEVHELKYFPEYEALSYTWADASGNAERTRKFYLGNAWSVFPITANCEAALRCLRLPNKERAIWIDALCINQLSVLERSCQAQMMPIIYSSAQRVLVYLGDDQPQLDLRAKHLHAYKDEWVKEWEAMDDMLKRPYFFRSWIIQEIASARSALVTDGKGWRVWPIFEKSPNTSLFLPWLRQSHNRKYLYKTPSDLVQLMIDSWTSQVYDPRDKVFSLLGVIPGAAADGLVADYSLTVEQVHTGFAAFALEKNRAADILKYAGGYVKSSRLPSWVPDWHLLSQDWDIMANIRNFHSPSSQDSFALASGISHTRSELICQPWLRNDISPVSFGGIKVHGPTGSLCVPGFKITDISEDYSKKSLSTDIAFPITAKTIKAESLLKRFRNDKLPEATTFTGTSLFIIAPHTAEKGDAVYFLHSIGQPVVLRPLSQPTIFSLVGTCFVRVQTGVSLHRGTGPLVGPMILRWLVDDGRDSWSVFKMPGHLKAAIASPHPSDDFTATLRLLENANREGAFCPSGLSEKCLELFQKLGEEVEKSWSAVVQQLFPILFLIPSLRKFDIAEPVIPVLEEMRRKFNGLAGIWGDVLRLVQARKGMTVVGEETRIEYTRRAEAYEALAVGIRDRIVEDREGNVMEELKERIAKLYMSGIGQAGENTVGREEGEEGGEWEGSEDGGQCPMWHRCVYGGTGVAWWDAMRRSMFESAGVYLRKCLDAEADEEEEVSAWKEKFELAGLEVEMAMRAVGILMERRREYVELMKEGWKPIVIV